MAARFWTCQRSIGGVRCGARNPRVKQKCVACGSRRPTRKRPAHMAALDVPYEQWVAEFGEVCGICGAKPSSTRRLDRDHVHEGEGLRRGLLCHWCNRMLPRRVSPEWLRAAADYVERALHPPG